VVFPVFRRPHVKAVSNTSLPVVWDNETGTRCLSHHFRGWFNNGNRAIQIWGLAVIYPVGSGHENNCFDEDQQQLQKTDPFTSISDCVSLQLTRKSCISASRCTSLVSFLFLNSINNLKRVLTNCILGKAVYTKIETRKFLTVMRIWFWAPSVCLISRETGPALCRS
jgi:hypothetical protein